MNRIDRNVLTVYATVELLHDLGVVDRQTSYKILGTTFVTTATISYKTIKYISSKLPSTKSIMNTIWNQEKAKTMEIYNRRKRIRAQESETNKRLRLDGTLEGIDHY